MKRQSHIYLVLACLGAALFLYASHLTVVAFEHYGASGTTVVPFLLALVFAMFGWFYGWVAFLFSYRAVAAMSSASGGVALEPLQGSFPQAVVVSAVTKMRTIGGQFSPNESDPAFTVFRAAGKFWVVSSAAFREAPAREA